LKPITEELKDLAIHGMVVKKNGDVVCRSKVHMLLCSGDIPAVAEMGHFGQHTSKFGCRICEAEGQKPDNCKHGVYFDNASAAMRPLNDFMLGNPVSD